MNVLDINVTYLGLLFKEYEGGMINVEISSKSYYS